VRVPDGVVPENQEEARKIDEGEEGGKGLWGQGRGEYQGDVASYWVDEENVKVKGQLALTEKTERGAKGK